MSRAPNSRRERIGLGIALAGFACFAISLLFLGPKSNPNWPAYVPMTAGGLATVIGLAIAEGGRGTKADRSARTDDEMPPNAGRG